MSLILTFNKEMTELYKVKDSTKFYVLARVAKGGRAFEVFWTTEDITQEPDVQ